MTLRGGQKQNPLKNTPDQIGVNGILSHPPSVLYEETISCIYIIKSLFVGEENGLLVPGDDVVVDECKGYWGPWYGLRQVVPDHAAHRLSQGLAQTQTDDVPLQVSQV